MTIEISEVDVIIAAVLADTGISWQTVGYFNPVLGPFRIIESVDRSDRAKVVSAKGQEVMGGYKHRCVLHCDALNTEHARYIMLKPDGPRCPKCGSTARTARGVRCNDCGYPSK